MVADPAKLRSARVDRRRGYEEYHPYGTTAWQAPSLTTISVKRYRYTGMERDEETGLQRHGVRYYAVWLGRWVSADPIGLGDGVNRYGYCHGRPPRGVDLSGLADRLPASQLTSSHLLSISGRELFAMAEAEADLQLLPVGLQAYSAADYERFGSPTLYNMERAQAVADKKAGIDTSGYVSRLKAANSEGRLESMFAADRTTGQPATFSMEKKGSGGAGDPLNLWFLYEGAVATGANGEVIGKGCAAACKLKLADNRQSTGGANSAIPERDVAQAAGATGKWISMPLEANVATLDRIDAELAAGRAVMVGASNRPGTEQGKLGDAVTDHFFIVFGRTVGAGGEVEYLYVDNATQQKDKKVGSLNVNPFDGTIFDDQSAIGSMVVTQVR